MACTNTTGVFTLRDVRSKQAANVWPVTASGTELSFTPNITIGSSNTNISFTIDTKGRYPPGSLIYWSIASNSAAFIRGDFTDQILCGSLSVNSTGQASFTKAFSFNCTRADYTSASNTNFTFKVVSGSAQGPTLATSPLITVLK
jgi:hypothetical protein